MSTLSVLQHERPQAPWIPDMTAMQASRYGMTEANERLARVETRLDAQGDTLSRLERHMESMSDAHSEMAKAVAQLPQLLEKNQDLQRVVADQGDRLAAVETQLEEGSKTHEHIHKVLEPKVNRSHFIANIGAWAAAILIAAIITAVVRGWINEDMVWTSDSPDTSAVVSSPADAAAVSTPSTPEHWLSWRPSGSTSVRSW